MSGIIAVCIVAAIAYLLTRPDPNDLAYDEDFSEQYAKRRSGNHG